MSRLRGRYLKRLEVLDKLAFFELSQRLAEGMSGVRQAGPGRIDDASLGFG